MTTARYLESAWTWNPVLIAVCALVVAWYFAATKFRLEMRGLYFLGGITVLFLALSSPLNALAAGFLFSAHMLQHMLLLLIVPMLLLLGLPTRGNETRKWQRFKVPTLAAWTGGVGAMWLWHERTLCDLATRTETVRVIQIVTLLGLGALFWWPLIGPRQEKRVSPITGVVYLFSACIACSVLGIFITFSPTGTVCPIFLHPPGRVDVLNLIRNDWGFTAAKDQQIGGLLMWLPGCGIYLAGVMAMFSRWYGAERFATPSRKEKPLLIPQITLKGNDGADVAK